MNSGPALVFYLLVLILPISALVARRLPARQWLPMAAIWVAIFGIGWIVIASFT